MPGQDAPGAPGREVDPGAARPGTPLLTFGHGTAAQDEILALLRGAGVGLLVDVRRFPGSRRNPHVARDELARWLPEGGIAYRWEPRLGGRRTVPKTAVADPAGPGADAPAGPADPWWRVEAFRAYAAHTRTDEFREAMGELLADVGRGPGATVVLCSETVWWRCHRRIVSDVAVLLHGVPVEHLGHDGRRTPHPPAAGARVAPDGVHYDGTPDHVDADGP